MSPFPYDKKNDVAQQRGDQIDRELAASDRKSELYRLRDQYNAELSLAKSRKDKIRLLRVLNEISSKIRNFPT
jgi:hypothetical protein